jgi:hypothetical protein
MGSPGASFDDRQPGKVRHTVADLLAQRIYSLACGHPDANDADRLADDPIHKLLLGWHDRHPNSTDTPKRRRVHAMLRPATESFAGPIIGKIRYLAT